MDLYAYGQIDRLSKIMFDNGIAVPRLRGLRLMKEEKPAPEEDLQNIIDEAEVDACKEACVCDFKFNANWAEHSDRTMRACRRYMSYNNNGDPIAVKWDKLHGKKRKLVKYLAKRNRKDRERDVRTFNKYCGREDVLYIHARIGGWNWNYYGGPELAKQPWFLEKVDDWWDGTYCDIYARIKAGGQDD